MVAGLPAYLHNACHHLAAEHHGDDQVCVAAAQVYGIVSYVHACLKGHQIQALLFYRANIQGPIIGCVFK